MGNTLIWFWGRLGAGPLITAQLCALAHARGTPIVVSISRDGETLPLINALPTHSTTLDMLPTEAALTSKCALLMAIPKWRAHFKALLIAHNITHIIVPMSFAACPLLIDIPHRLGIRITYFLHDLTPHAGDPTAYIHALPQRWIMRHVDKILCLSDYTRTLAQQKYPHIACEMLPLAGLYPPSHTHRSACNAPIRFLVVGRLQAYKGLNVLAQALNSLNANVNYTLTIAGNPHHRAEIEALFAPFPQVNLQLRWHEHSEIDVYYQSHDVLIAPYTSASQSGPVAQAVATAMPAIVCDAGALAEQIEHGAAGWIVSVGDATTLASIITDVSHILPSEYAQKSAAAHACALNARTKWHVSDLFS